MKFKPVILVFILFLCSHAHAGWFSRDKETEQKLHQVENQLTTQKTTTDRWQIAAYSLAASCLLLFIVGTALGSKTRRESHEQS